MFYLLLPPTGRGPKAAIRSAQREHGEKGRYVLYKLRYHDYDHLEKKHERGNGL